ncbi:MAG: transaldolase [Bdellovibrionota bacterium]
MSFSASFLREAMQIADQLDESAIERAVQVLRRTRDNQGRLFLIGSGGGAGHASHATCDFRKLCSMEAYCPTDNVSELTARINDEGWDSSLANWLKTSRLNGKDCLFVFSVGGGSEDKNISVNLVNAMKAAKEVGASIVGVVGRDGGFTAKVADAAIVVPTVDASRVTPHTEAFQALVWHLIVSHPALQTGTAKWEGTQSFASKSGQKATSIHQLHVKVFADGAELAGMLEMYRNPLIAGFTTNPTLMKKAGIVDYAAFGKDVLTLIKDKPISFEVFSDDFAEMEAQALTIASWGENVYVKIPITNTRGESAVPLVKRLTAAGVKVNVTAIMTLEQIEEVLPALKNTAGAYVSVFAGRIADTGRDPLPMMKATMKMLAEHPAVELIWASPRELLNIFQANEIGCHVITVTNDVLKKLTLVGKDLSEYSLETVQMFRNDAVSAGFSLEVDSDGKESQIAA